jgi:hypothetical protein
MSRSRSSSDSSGAREVQKIMTNRNTFDAESNDRPLIQKRHSEPNLGENKAVIRVARRKSLGDKTRGHANIHKNSPRSSNSSLLGGSKTIKSKGRRKSQRKSTRKRRRIFF